MARGRVFSTAELSRRAVENAAHSGWTSPGELASCLYRYNRVPMTAARIREFDDAAALSLPVLSLSAAGGVRVRTLSPEDRRDPWRRWVVSAAAPVEPRAPAYKLYVSPVLDDLPAALAAVLAGLADSRARLAKVGRRLEDLLRADKLVLYFARESDAERAAARLLRELGPLRAQGVPFTRQIGPTALVSLGVDPPALSTARRAEGARSWRALVTGRLARALALEKAQGRPDAAERALARLRASGIDTDDWRPGSVSWDRSPAGGA
jgi:hypothetical protein